jgi:predicted transcriptional regulator
MIRVVRRTVSLREDLAKSIDTIAAEQDRPLSRVFGEALSLYAKMVQDSKESQPLKAVVDERAISANQS